MSYVVYYSNCGAWYTEVFTEDEFDHIFESVATHPNMSWMIVP